MSLYWKEKYGAKVISTDEGYILYNAYEDNSVYIRELFVKREARNKGVGKELEDKLIEKENPNFIFCDIDLESNNPEIALVQIIKKAGYKIDHVTPSGKRIVLYKQV